jgi:uncharacterized protein (TIGR02284 family)
MNSNPNSGTTSNYGTDATGEAVRQLNSLLRGEISAAETYKMAIDKVAQNEVTDDVSTLRQMQEEHGRAAQMLRGRIRALGGEASDSSGAWGAWAQTVQGTMNLFGDSAALKSLKEGEEHGLKDYREALDDVDANSADLISSEMIPLQCRHIDLLDRLINSAGRA